jgi:hypothetical protein
MFNQITTHVTDALGRLLGQYQGATNLRNLLTALVNPIQDIEDELTEMNVARYLGGATGAQLDILGSIVGIPRGTGISDATYAQQIAGQVKINTSQGQPEQVIQAFQLFTGGNTVILQELIAAVILQSTWLPPDQASADAVFLLLLEVLPAGVRCSGIVSFDPDMAFAYDGALPGYGYDDGSGTVGGKYARLWLYSGGNFAYDGDDSTALGYGTYFDPLAGGDYLT